MNRHEFFVYAATGIGTLLVSRSMAGCSDTPAEPPQPTLDFTLRLTDQANQSLLTAGGYVIANGVLIVRTAPNDYVAVSAKCTHEGTQLVYRTADKQFYCPLDLSRFDLTGAVVSGPATQPLTRYKVSPDLQANAVRVTN